MKTILMLAIVFFATMLAATGLQAQTDFMHVGDEPVFEPGAPGEWDEFGVYHPAVIFADDTLRMWYGATSAGLTRIGYAWSLDGIDWHRYAGNPVLTPTLDWEHQSTGNTCHVRKDGDTYKMWYRAGQGRFIGYATSMDGVTWNKHPEPVLEIGALGDWDDASIRPKAVIREANREHKMWYIGTSTRKLQLGFLNYTGLATSSDGINWVKYDDPATTDAPLANSDFVLGTGAPFEDWDDLGAKVTGVLPTAFGYEMWYIGVQSDISLMLVGYVGYATSPDGIRWEKWPTNPTIDTPPSWAVRYIGGSVLQFDNRYHFWFGGQLTFGFRNTPDPIGYAISPITVSVATGEDDSGIPSEHLLLQNYPNPFNPSTTINYSVERGGRAELRIYDLLGRKVRSLVQENKPAGEYSVIWNGRDDAGRPMASGSYFYELRVGEFISTKRMLLLK